MMNFVLMATSLSYHKIKTYILRHQLYKIYIISFQKGIWMSHCIVIMIFIKICSLSQKLHPNLIFCIEVVVSEYMKMSREYYLNGKIIEDRGWFNLYYDGFEFEYNPNQ